MDHDQRFKLLGECVEAYLPLDEPQLQEFERSHRADSSRAPATNA